MHVHAMHAVTMMHAYCMHVTCCMLLCGVNVAAREAHRHVCDRCKRVARCTGTRSEVACQAGMAVRRDPRCINTVQPGSEIGGQRRHRFIGEHRADSPLCVNLGKPCVPLLDACRPNTCVTHGCKDCVSVKICCAHRNYTENALEVTSTPRTCNDMPC